MLEGLLVVSAWACGAWFPAHTGQWSWAVSRLATIVAVVSDQFCLIHASSC